MAFNELNQEVPPEVVEKARELGCKGEVSFVYRDGEYGPGKPAASIGPSKKASRFRSPNYELWKVPLVLGWIAFEQPGLPPAFQYDPSTDNWVAEAIPLVEASINDIVRDFLRHPYLHRVEHSMHAHLINSLSVQPHFSGQHRIGSTGEVTQLIHKEWPETTVREEKDGRGNFDIAILSPALLAQCNRLRHFADGWLPVPIVIEMGLNYSLEHYEQDRSKLVNSSVHRGYLIHLLREYPDDIREKASIEFRENDPQIQTAYGRVRGVHQQIKLLSDPEITSFQDAPQS
ncbi:MAG: hypothetical protein WCJ35_11575 [Planctomycetota bacterium]